MLIGYARVSTEDQDPQYQLDALKAAGCVQVFQDRASGATLSRVGLDQALAALTPGYTLVAWKLDRVGRTWLETVRTIVDLDRRGIEFRSLTESFDTRALSDEVDAGSSQKMRRIKDLEQRPVATRSGAALRAR
ncbi:recombinase family protein [Methylobacterium oryzisoli]|uniref:recombinase family protein n=1 Tax=Methylobacterium oryzisoli TaxID=3385502 RepID=UPI003892C971